MNDKTSLRKNRPFGLRARITALVAFAAVVVAGTGAALSYMTMTRAFESNRYSSGIIQTEQGIRQAISNTPFESDPQAYLQALGKTYQASVPRVTNWRFILVTSPTGKPLIFNDDQQNRPFATVEPGFSHGYPSTSGPRPTASPSLVPEASSPREDGLVQDPVTGTLNSSAMVTDRVGDQQLFIATAPAGKWEVRLETSIDTSAYGGFQRAMWEQVALATVVVTGLACLAAWFLAGLIQRPVRRLAAAAKEIGAGNLDVRAPVSSRDEFADLGVDFNEMTDALVEARRRAEASAEQQRAFVADLAHELRTPTFALLSAATALENPETRDEAATLVVPQLRRLTQLTEDMMMLARLDAGQAPLRPELVDVVDVIATELQSHSEVHWEMSAPRPVAANVDVARLRMIVRNLVINAMRYGAEPFTCQVSEHGAMVKIIIRDGGEPIPAGLRERVFERFVQGDSSRTGDGSGLGLAIARESARLHGGDLVLADDGKSFICTLASLPE